MMQAHGVDLLDICAGGHLDMNTQSWLGDRSDALRATISTTASSFFNQAASLYTMISTSDAVQALRNLTVKADSAWQSNVITFLPSIEQIQCAPTVMQRYLMAQPDARQMYLNGEISGYGENYENLHGDGVGAKHYDWRRVMDGIVTVNSEGFSHTTYVEDTRDDAELTVFEKVDILRTWNVLQASLSAGEQDPTSPEGLMLG
ncbi:hypothetical protein MZD04_gp060 [Pseudomonas phage Psa21]|uniref:Uncharacterized protein n=1 Tax=Pseudomonas phage Psa21 TaxID=2530023 RepID=A0A481W498_9CAUD|nr:hypothetical protein MZD04_gp060 [Pseudomonas phage Psa21]QBJ02589.1 hypothetical protein PSA21_60 [Pseudomonas phage Psa21]